MTAVRKSVIAPQAPLTPPQPAGYVAGGDVGVLQSELERRLRVADAGATPASAPATIDSVVRATSVSAGYLLLGGGYVAAGTALWHWFG